MPHIRLTASQNAASEARIRHLLPELVALLCTFETVEPPAVKAYAEFREHWAMGEGAPMGFVHCEVCLLQGRDEALRARIAEAFRDCLQEWFTVLVVTKEVGVTVEIREMDLATYRKTKRP